MYKILVFLLPFLLALNAETKIRFDNHKVYSLKIKNEEQLTVLRRLESHPVDGYHLWNSVVPGKNADLMVAPHMFQDFQDLAESFAIEYELKVENVQKLIDNERPRAHPRIFGWTDYNSFDEIQIWLDDLLLQYPDILTNQPIGTTHQGRQMRGVKLSHKEGNPTILIDAHIHAAEWISSALSTWFLKELLTSTDPAIVNLAQNYDWYIVPIINADGYEYSRNVNRLWRKTRYPHSHLCYGADPNRNFEYQWMTDGATNDPCSDIFAGPHPFSEVETQYLSAFYRSISADVKLYITLHSYGQGVLFPYAWTIVRAPNHDTLSSIALVTADAIGQRFGSVYVTGNAEALYIGAGQCMDWIYAIQNVSLAYTFELRDHWQGAYGFILPADQIIDACLEATDGIVAMVAEIRRQELF